MNSKHFLVAALLASPFLTSCGPSVAVLSKSDIKSRPVSLVSSSPTRSTASKASVASKAQASPAFSNNTPSSSLSSVAASKPKDKHSMPIYKFGERNRIVRTTAYTCSEDDHLIYGSKNAAGTTLRYSDRVRSAAADWSFYPVGTVFRIKGMNELYVVDDYGSALTGTGTIDMYQPTKELMNKWGRRNVELTIIQWGSFKRSAELLAGRTSYSHCREMLANIQRQQPDLSRVAKN